MEKDRYSTIGAVANAVLRDNWMLFYTEDMRRYRLYRYEVFLLGVTGICTVVMLGDQRFVNVL